MSASRDCPRDRPVAASGFEDRVSEQRTARTRLIADGWLYLPQFQPEDDRGERMLAFARSLGPLYAMGVGSPAWPVVETLPSPEAPGDEPFNQLSALGWHNDFSSRRYRPRWSLSYIRTGDAEGGGCWRVAEGRKILARLRAAGREDVVSALRERWPFSFTGEGAPVWFRGLTRNGLRFYGRTMRAGARLVQGDLPERVDEMIRAVEGAADDVGSTLRAVSGALLVVDNTRILHDRTEQMAGSRRAVLGFADAELTTPRRPSP